MLTAAEIFRDYQVDGVPSSGPNKPDKASLRVWGGQVEAALNSASASLIFANLGALNADLAHAPNTAALVYGDPTAANNGLYQKQGASGFGSWLRIGDLADSIVPLTVTGGTANAIVATAPQSPSSPGSKLYILVPSANNTTASSISINGGALAGAIKDVFGNDTASNALVANSPVIMMWSVDRFRLVTSSGADASGILASALAAQTAAQGYASAAATSAAALGAQVRQYDTVTQLAAATVPTLGSGGPTGVRTFGRGVAGDCPPMFWTRISAPGSPRSWHVQSADGQWWLMNLGWIIYAAQFATGRTITGIQDALDYLQINGLIGGRAILEPNSTYTGTAAPNIWHGLTLDGNGSKIQFTLSGAGKPGLRVGDNAEFCNGWAHCIDGGVTDASAFYGAGISLGEMIKVAGNVIGSPAYFAGSDGTAGTTLRPRLRNVKASTTKVGGQAIQGMGDIDVDIDGIEIPDSTAMGGGISMDWSDIGGSTVGSGTGGGGAYASDLEYLTLWRTAFNAGTMVTTHPRGNIRRVRQGVLTNTSSRNGVVRLSACRDMTVYDVSAKETTGPVFNNVGGDLGFECAPPSVKSRAYRNIFAGKLQADKCDSWGIYIDTWGDNLGGAIALGYSNLTPAVSYGYIVVDQANLAGLFSGSSNDGVRLMQAKGVTLRNLTVAGFAYGIRIEDNTESCSVNGGLVFANQKDGVSIKGVSTIKKIRFDGMDVQGNGAGGTGYAGFRISGGSGIVIAGNSIGADGETTQENAVYVDVGVVKGVSITRNKIRDVKAGHPVFVVGAGGSDVLWIINDNEYQGSEVMVSGQEVLPIERTPRIQSGAGSAGWHTRYICRAVAMSAGVTPPAGPTYIQGDLCEVPDAASSACALARRGASTWASVITAP